ncbi:hypothetical protein [Trujillonella humicola]|uniref:hypothetical protein n=1 Tax=Trujillonella humicola TaxID=3383699 RepID=UPI00390638A0
MRLPHRLRRRLEAALNDRVDRRTEALVARLDALAAREAELREQVRADLRAELAERAFARDLTHVSERVDELERRLGAWSEGYEARFGALEERADWNAHQLSRLAPQAAALEERLERAARPVVVTPGDDADVAEARMLVEVVREEHARVRSRLSLLSAYEERLRVLEARAFPPGADGS